MGLGAHQATLPNQTPNTTVIITGVRRWGINFIVERETAQIAGQGPKCELSAKGSEVAKTARMLA